MEDLAKTAVILICILCIGLQHLFNYFIRQDINKNPLPIVGVGGIIISLIILGTTIIKAIQIW